MTYRNNGIFPKALFLKNNNQPARKVIVEREDERAWWGHFINSNTQSVFPKTEWKCIGEDIIET